MCLECNLFFTLSKFHNLYGNYCNDANNNWPTIIPLNSFFSRNY